MLPSGHRRTPAAQCVGRASTTLRQWTPHADRSFPAKALDYETAPTTDSFTYPGLIEHSKALIEILRECSPAEIARLMKLSDQLAALNVARYAQWQPAFSPANSKQAMLAFDGDVYDGLAAVTLEQGGLDWAQQHLRILSGLYGVLRPLDLMQPYRLEMGTRLANSRGATLYAFWGGLITDELNRLLEAQAAAGEEAVVVNLASTGISNRSGATSCAAASSRPCSKTGRAGATRSSASSQNGHAA